ncbi:aspartate/glutamate racemase family protein [Roseomonas elaeocarpi]|uniref:Aspartate/glutamate racemase family protein n=1 Tax=Roseomonas elaeocarpi TaxID=907779 RepID=A0ABV6JW35_9PROT
MRMLLLNGNTDAAMTERLRALAQARLDRLGRAEVVLQPATARFGARYIATRAAAAVAAHAVIEQVAEHAASVDAVAIACFGDPGLLAAREIVPLPVRAMAEASIEAALRLAPRAVLLTGGPLWVPMLGELAHALGYGADRVLVRAVAPPGDVLARDPEGSAALLAEAAAEAVRDGAGAVVLGGAGLAGLAPPVAARLAARLAAIGGGATPVLDSLDCLLDAALAPSAAAFPAAPSAPSVGLSPSLAAALSGGR